MYSHPQTLKTPARRDVPSLLRGSAPLRGALRTQKVLVPVDGSAESMRALEHAIDHSGAADVNVHLLNVQPQIMAGDVGLFMSAAMVADTRMAAAMEALRPARELLERRGVPYTTEILFGSPAETIVRCAAQRGCAEIVMGTRDRGLFASLLAPSVARDVVRRAHVPVTLLKQPGAARRALLLCVECLFGKSAAVRGACACST